MTEQFFWPLWVSHLEVVKLNPCILIWGLENSTTFKCDQTVELGSVAFSSRSRIKPLGNLHHSLTYSRPLAKCSSNGMCFNTMILKISPEMAKSPLSPSEKIRIRNNTYVVQLELSVQATVNQEHPTTVFCKISVRRRKYCLEFSIAWGRLKIVRWPFHSCTSFEAYLTNSRIFNSKVEFFAFHFPCRKRKPKIRWTE